MEGNSVFIIKTLGVGHVHAKHFQTGHHAVGRHYIIRGSDQRMLSTAGLEEARKLVVSMDGELMKCGIRCGETKEWPRPL